ncbi:MAG TPA: GFA family protein [Methylibium sp.]|uniref:GFA family protein n=1 Tax=Methylibium sp. TaxID=2067992 RepID=UPI002DB728DC|nr:GFA family protein [Methylibium sp.]HEU4458014.1 GFA family protein [Methylibium sp.]
MPLKLEASCRCGKVRFSAESHAPVPFMRCYCSICRKTAGGGGYAINLHADKRSLRVEGETAVYRAELADVHGACRVSGGERHFCAACATALWMFDPTYPELFHPFASAMDSALPKAPSSVHMMLASKARWVEPAIGAGDRCFDGHPEATLEDWHRERGLWVD